MFTLFSWEFVDLAMLELHFPEHPSLCVPRLQFGKKKIAWSLGGRSKAAAFNLWRSWFLMEWGTDEDVGTSGSSLSSLPPTSLPALLSDCQPNSPTWTPGPSPDSGRLHPGLSFAEPLWQQNVPALLCSLATSHSPPTPLLPEERLVDWLLTSFWSSNSPFGISSFSHSYLSS